MTDDHPDTDLTDPHGEAEALRRENEALAAWACPFRDGSGLTHDEWGQAVCRKSDEAEALRRENARLRAAADGAAYEAAKLLTFAEDERDAAIARAEAAEAALAASRAPDPAVNAGSCQPGDRYQHIKRGTTYQVIGRGKLQTDVPLTDYAEVVAYRCEETGDVWVRPKSEFTPDRFLALPAAPVAEAMPDWKAMAERLGEALENRDGGGHDDDCKVHRPAMGFFAQACNCGHDDARAALSDLAKMKGE